MSLVSNVCQWQVPSYKDEALNQAFPQGLFGKVRSAGLHQQAKLKLYKEKMKTCPCGQEGRDGTKRWKLRAVLPAPPRRVFPLSTLGHIEITRMLEGCLFMLFYSWRGF